MTGVEFHIPEHTLEEKEREIVIVIVAPLSKPKEAAFVLEKDVFTFESPPYLLKMKLPHPVHDRFSQQAYDNDTKTYKIKLKKNFEFVEAPDDEDDEDDEEINVNMTTYSEREKAANDGEGKKQFYGFSNKYSNMFGNCYTEFSEVISVPNPDFTDLTERRKQRKNEEDEKWSDDHYLADTMETDHLESIFKYKPPWIVSPVKGDFSSDEKEILGEIMNKSKLENLSEENVRLSEFQIVDVLFGFAYNKRTTEGDNSVESGWTINKLSSTLCWFEVFEDFKSVILSCFRRSLIFPLYRNWNLAAMIQEDVVNILGAGSKQVTCCLLEVRDIFNDSDNRYILNSLYVNDLCNFAVHMSDERCLEIAAAVKEVEIKKWEVNGDLEVLEIAAEWALIESESGEKAEKEMSEIVSKIKALNLDLKYLSVSSSESTSEESESADASDEED